jgi:thioredoxin-dependent peroxiredoxin
MSIRINDIAPDFTADSTAGTIHFHDWLAGGYAIIFSHPRDFTPVCTTEFGAVAQLAAEWKKRNTKVIGVSVDSVADHGKWKRDIEAFAGSPADFPIIDDTSLTVAKAYDMLPAEFYLPSEGRTPANTATVRTVYIIGPDKKVRLTMTYPMSVGRNFAEILRASGCGAGNGRGANCDACELGSRPRCDRGAVVEQRSGEREVRGFGHQTALFAVCQTPDLGESGRLH